MTNKTDLPGVTVEEVLTPAQKAARTRAANKAAKAALATAPVATVEDVTTVLDELSDHIDEAGENDEFIALVKNGTPGIPAAARNVIYTVGIVLGGLAAVGGVAATFVTGDLQPLVLSVVGVAKSLTDLLAKLNLSRTATEVAGEPSVG